MVDDAWRGTTVVVAPANSLGTSGRAGRPLSTQGRAATFADLEGKER